MVVKSGGIGDLLDSILVFVVEECHELFVDLVVCDILSVIRIVSCFEVGAHSVYWLSVPRYIIINVDVRFVDDSRLVFMFMFIMCAVDVAIAIAIIYIYLSI